MTRYSIVCGLTALDCACALLSIPALAAEKDGFIPLFNGQNLDGWDVASPGAWKANDGILENHSGHSAIISQKKYANYVLTFEWRIPKDDPHQNGILLYLDRGAYTPKQKNPVRNGFFVPGPSITPNLVGTWNRTRVTVESNRCVIEVNDRVIRTAENLSGGNEAGKFGIGRDGARLDLANIYLKELNSDKSKPEASLHPEGFVPLFNGRNLDGWRTSPQTEKYWCANNSILESTGRAPIEHADLWSTKNLRDFTLVLDWRVLDGDAPHEIGLFIRIPGGELDPGRDDMLRLRSEKKPGEWNRSIVTVFGDSIEVSANDQPALDWGPVTNGLREEGLIGLQARNYRVEFENIYIREWNGPIPAKYRTSFARAGKEPK